MLELMRLAIVLAASTTGALGFIVTPGYDENAFLQSHIEVRGFEPFFGVPMPSMADSDGARLERLAAERIGDFDMPPALLRRRVFERQVMRSADVWNPEVDSLDLQETMQLVARSLESEPLEQRGISLVRHPRSLHQEKVSAGENSIISSWLEAHRHFAEGPQPPVDELWHIRANGTDASDPGVVFHYSPGEEGSVKIRSKYGKYLFMSDGHLRGDGLFFEPGTMKTLFSFQAHPRRGRAEHDVICWKTFNGSYVGVSPDGQLQEFPDAAGKETKFRLAHMGGNRIVLMSSAGLVTADKDMRALSQWLNWFRSSQAYQGHQLEVEAAKVLDRFGWKRGWVLGVVTGGFFMLAFSNAVYSFSDESEPRAGLRAFDVARFVLEFLVIYSNTARVLGLWDWGISQWLSAYKMPTFAFLAGVFGAKVSYQSLARVSCCTLGVLFIALLCRLIEIQAIWGSHITSKNTGRGFNIDEWLPGTWFLATLFVWRFTLSPLFVAVQKAPRPQVVAPLTLALVWIFSFLLLAWTSGWGVWMYGQYNWQHALYFAPFFAAGLLWGPEEWDCLFRTSWFRSCCGVFFLSFHVLTAISSFKNWTKASSCLPLTASSCYMHLYPEALVFGVHAGPFFYDLLLFVLRCSLAVSVACLLHAAASLLERFQPYAASMAGGWGSRTLYAYVMHVHLLNMAEKDGSVAEAVGHWAPGTRFVVAIVISAIASVSLSSAGTEYWFHWFLRPYWIKDVLEHAVQTLQTRAKGKGREEPEKKESTGEAADPAVKAAGGDAHAH